jgi:hypothetical protein
MASMYGSMNDIEWHTRIASESIASKLESLATNADIYSHVKNKQTKKRFAFAEVY